MKLSSSFLLAFRFIFPKHNTPSNARKSIIGSIMCIALSIIPLIVVLIVTDGMIDGFTSRIISLSSYDMQLVPYVSTIKGINTYEDYVELAKSVEKIEGVESVTVERQGIALAAGKSSRMGATVRGVDVDLITKNKSFQKYMNVKEGEFDLSQPRNAVIGTKLAKTLNLSVGDDIRIISSKSMTGGNIIPRFSNFKVKGIISSGYQELDSLWVFIPAQTAFNLFSTASSKIILGVETKSTLDNELYEIADRIETKIDYPFSIYTWQELNSSKFENFASTKVLLLLIMSLILLVASINVSSSIVMLVMERRKEIAILKSMGASNQGITFTFLLIALFIGICGLLLGFPLGILCSVNINAIISFLEKAINFVMLFGYNLFSVGNNFTPVSVLNPEYYLETIPVVLPFTELILICLLVLVLSIIVSIIPSVKAGKEKPLSILRKV